MIRTIALLLLLLAPAAARAADYWVAANGNNNAAGTMMQPWATLQYAAGRVMAGDVVHVLAGNYVGFDLRRSGMMNAPITFLAEPGARITQRNAATPDGINVETADYVIIDGFTVDGMPRAGVRCALGRFVTIRRIHADSNGRWGIFTGCCPDLTIEDNFTSRSVAEHGIYVSNSADRPIIRRNTTFSNFANGIHMNGDLSIDCGNVTQQDGVISNAVVERNVIYDNGRGGGSGINCDGVADSIIRNNLIYNTHASGISLYRIDAGAGATNNRVTHNTVVVAADGRWALNIADASTGNFVRNNIFLTYHAFRGSIVISNDSRPGFTSDYNVVTPRLSPDGDQTILNLTQWRMLGYDANSIASDPASVFESPMTNDYHLRMGSPAIDRAEMASGAMIDLEGNMRPAGPGYDIGAYERPVAPPDAGMPDAAGAPDLMSIADLSMPRDLSIGSDLAAAPDLSSSVDAAAAADLSGAADLARPPDLIPAPDQGDTDAGAAAASADCGCRLGRPAPAGWPLAAAAALLALAFRRRRR